MRLPYHALRMAGLAAISCFLLGLPARAEENPVLSLGDLVVTGFSGSAAEGAYPDEKTLINPLGKSVRILDVRSPGYPWDGRVWSPVEKSTYEAARLGQVFGVAIDDAEAPNIYLAASSYYGLYITGPDKDADGQPDRLLTGGPDAQWMAGMFGDAALGGGPGSIWKIDGVSGEVALFANVAFDGQDNPGPGLGNLAYDPAHKQLFVSDLATGMVHRYNLSGEELEVYDHGNTGRGAANLNPIGYDPANRLNIAAEAFDSAKPETWGYAPPERRVLALAVHQGRLYYAVASGQIWSAGLEAESGKFDGGSRLEFDLPKDSRELPVTDMVFSDKGALILAQRGAPSSLFDYTGLAETGRSHLFRFWPESPDDPETAKLWKPEAEDYPIGFAGDNRNSNGGVDLSYGYSEGGLLDTGVCEATLWGTGDDLRLEQGLSDALLPGGPLTVDGLIGLPSLPVKPVNAPPWASYVVDTIVRSPDADNTYGPDAAEQQRVDAYVEGYTGDVAVYRKACGSGGGGEAVSVYSGPGYEELGESGIWTTDRPKPVPACMKPKGKFVCDTSTGTWSYELGLNVKSPEDADTIRITGVSPGIKITNGPLLPISAITRLQLTGKFKGQLMNVGLCAYEQSALEAGKPFSCCKALVSAYTPVEPCVKK